VSEGGWCSCACSSAAKHHLCGAWAAGGHDKACEASSAGGGEGGEGGGYEGVAGDKAALYSRFSVIPPTSTTKPPHVGIRGSLVVESRKNGQIFRGIIWWNYLVGSSEFPRAPARPPVAPPHPARRLAPSAAATPRRTAELHSSPALFRCRRSTDIKPF
jgi:hypothetical protein